MIQNIYLVFFFVFFFKGLGCKSLMMMMMSSKWMVSFQKCMRCTKPSPSMQCERLFSWICYEMWVDKYENINIERIYSILLYELTHLICWLKAYSSKLLCVTVCVSACVCVCVYILCVRALKTHSAERSSLRKHSRTSRLHKHSCITQIRCCCAYCTTSKHALIAFIKTPMSY